LVRRLGREDVEKGTVEVAAAQRADRASTPRRAAASGRTSPIRATAM
jgi:hypothetical protein